MSNAALLAREDVIYVGNGETVMLPSLLGLQANDFIHVSPASVTFVQSASGGAGSVSTFLPQMQHFTPSGYFSVGPNGQVGFRANQNAAPSGGTVTQEVEYRLESGSISTLATVKFVIFGEGTGMSSTGRAGDDVLSLDVAKFDQTLRDGGDGTDTIVVTLRRAEADFVKTNGGFDFRVDSGTTFVPINAERIDFADGVLAFDLDGRAGQTFRLYQAAFDRTPDAEGLKFWLRQYDLDKVDLSSMARSFLVSQEFIGTFGTENTVSADGFIDLLYLHTLNRTADQAGKAFWSGKMADGLTRADLLVHFSESAENQDQVAPAILDGIWMPHLMPPL